MKNWEQGHRKKKKEDIKKEKEKRKPEEKETKKKNINTIKRKEMMNWEQGHLKKKKQDKKKGKRKKKTCLPVLPSFLFFFFLFFFFSFPTKKETKRWKNKRDLPIWKWRLILRRNKNWVTNATKRLVKLIRCNRFEGWNNPTNVRKKI